MYEYFSMYKQNLISLFNILLYAWGSRYCLLLYTTLGEAMDKCIGIKYLSQSSSKFIYFILLSRVYVYFSANVERKRTRSLWLG